MSFAAVAALVVAVAVAPIIAGQPDRWSYEDAYADEEPGPPIEIPWARVLLTIGTMVGIHTMITRHAERRRRRLEEARRRREEEVFAAVKVAVRAEVDAFLRRERVQAGDVETLKQSIRRRALDAAERVINRQMR